MKTDKPWGYEKLIEHNEKYVVKEILMKEGHCCSLQYHEVKHETICVIKGTMKLVVGDDKDSLKDVIIEEGGYYVLPPMMVHRMCGVNDCTYIESSTPELDDLVRVEDDYGRD